VRFQILPLSPMGKNFSNTKKNLNDAFRKLEIDKQAQWLEPLQYDMNSTFSKEKEKVGNYLNATDFNESTHGPPILLIFLPSKNQGEFNRQTFKSFSSSYNFASQCVENWESASSSTSPWAAKELAISIYVKAGSQWKIMPNLADSGTYFIAFDVSSMDNVSRPAVYLVSSNGTVFKHGEPSPPQKGETIKGIGQMIKDTIQDAVEIEGGEPMRHLVISRDGRFQLEERTSIEELAQKHELNISMVEVTKSGPMVYRMIKLDDEGKAQGPDSGLWWKLDQNTANLCTTGSPGGSHIVPARGLSQPIAVTKVGGRLDETSLDQIVEWMFSLSRLTAYSDKPTRLPIHLHLADRSAKDYIDQIKYPNRRGIHAA
jgi:argonaute-like protein implicated in RNA metabolism and viral defense